jgi:hypothetical protein
MSNSSPDPTGAADGTDTDVDVATSAGHGPLPLTPTMLPQTGLSLDEARARLSGWHFAKEALTEGERSILFVAEGLLRLLDEDDPDGRRR